MRVPIRKPGKYTNLKRDVHVTAVKFDQLQKELEQLITISRPSAAAEVRRLAELGDFSENAAYQMAKGKLRGINQRIEELQEAVNHAVIIQPIGATSVVQLGSRVTVEMSGKQITYEILGSAEADPSRGVISQNSPIGSALMGRKVGERVTVRLAGKERECEIIAIA